jgi:hypothetical protein
VKSILAAFGIPIVYGLSILYLTHTFDSSNLLLKTAFLLIYSCAWMGPLSYLWWKGKVRESIIAPILVLCLAIFYTSTLTIIKVPMSYAYADVAFHAAKVLHSSTGHFFYDPVTSYPSIYPSVYHIILGWAMRLLGSDDAFYVLSRFHILMLIVLFLSVYLLANSLFNPRIGVLSVFLLGAIFDTPSESSMFYPTPFFMALTVIVNSITLTYMALQGKRWCLYAAGLLAGLAVTIWPAFFPLAIILALVIFFVPGKEQRQPIDLLKFALPFLGMAALVWIPQYLLLARCDLLGHHSMARITQIPDLGWLPDFLSRFIFLGGIDPNHQWVTFLFAANYIILIVTGLLGFRYLRKKEPRRKRFLTMHLLLILGVLVFVDYILGPTYSRRVQLIFSILLVTLTAHYLVGQLNRKYRILSISLMVWLVMSTCGWHVYNVNASVMKTKEGYEDWKRYAAGMLQFVESHTAYGEYIFATRETYRFVVLGNLIRCNLAAHRDGTYFSLNPGLSEKMLNDYSTIIASSDFATIRKTLKKYKIRYILTYKGEDTLHIGMKRLFENCTPVYQDDTFMVLKLE